MLVQDVLELPIIWKTIIVFLHAPHGHTLIPRIKLVLQAVYHQIMAIQLPKRV